MSVNLIGRILERQYRVEAFVDSGTMGAVYRVWDLKRSVYLAMKVLHADLADDPAMFKRFQREARALQKLAHPNIVPFYGLHKTNDLVFMLERFIDGSTLKDFLRRKPGQPLPVSESLVFLKAACAALGYAHANGVVHCDVKPANVMVDQGGNVYVTDFGIARHAESTTTTLASAGTPAYMPPEQIRGEAVAPATDVYALGVMLFEMLTGQRPFRGTESGTESTGATARERIRYAHLHLPAPNPQALNPQISPLLAEVVLQALQKVPTQRYQGALDFFVAACAAIGTSPDQIPDRLLTYSVPLDSLTQHASENTWLYNTKLSVSSPANRRFILPLILVIFAVLTVTGLYLAWGGTGRPSAVVDQLARQSLSTAQPIASMQTFVAPELQPTKENVQVYKKTPTIPPLATKTPSPSPTHTSPSPIPTKIPTEGPWEACPGSYLSQLHVNDRAYIAYDPPLPNRVRSKPSTDGTIIGQIQPGEEVKVLNGPACGNSWVWWYVRSRETGLTGWTAEGDYKDYWLVPFP